MSRRRINAVAAQGAPSASSTNPPTNATIGTRFAPDANPGAHVADGLAAISAMAMMLDAAGAKLAQLPPERALAIAQALEHLAGEYRRVARFSRGDLALLRRLEPCHDSMDTDIEPATIETQSMMVNTKEFAWLLGADPRTVERMRAAGEGPKAIRVRRKVLYRRRDVERWLKGKRS